jgi:hypothetical protein
MKIHAESKLIYIIALLMFAFMTKGSDAQPASTEWVTIDTISNVVVSYQLNSCQGQDKMYLKIENNNAVSVIVEWSFWGTDEHKSIEIGGNETKKGECNFFSPIELDELIPSGKTIDDLESNISVN